MLIMAVLSAGCVSTEFYAVSDTSGETGGITLVKSRTDTARNLFTHLKTVNYLIRDPASGLFLRDCFANSRNKTGRSRDPPGG